MSDQIVRVVDREVGRGQLVCVVVVDSAVTAIAVLLPGESAQAGEEVLSKTVVPAGRGRREVLTRSPNTIKGTGRSSRAPTVPEEGRADLGERGGRVDNGNMRTVTGVANQHRRVRGLTVSVP